MRTWGGQLSGVLVALACLLGCSTRTLNPDGIGAMGHDGGGDATPDLAARLALGRRCASPEECVSGFCAQGFCCDRACADPCWSCNQEVTAGLCLVLPPGTVCGAGTCEGDAVVGQKVCDGAGSCRSGPTTLCVPYTCDPAIGACRKNCVTDSDCLGTFCEPTGRCHLNAGLRCTQNTECASGFCVGGVCCNTACAGDCVSCDVAGHQGTCWPRPDPCPGADAASD